MRCMYEKLASFLSCSSRLLCVLSLNERLKNVVLAKLRRTLSGCINVSIFSILCLSAIIFVI